MSEVTLDAILEALTKPKFYASLGAKVNTGNYENKDLSFGISNVPVDCSAEYLKEVTEAAIARQNYVLNAFAGELDRILREDFGR